MEKEKYDVIIVGGGPGGLRCAEILGTAGKKVLLLEKNNVIGPKVCAGGLTRKAIAYLHDMGLPDDLIENTFDSIVFRKRKFKTYIDFGQTFLYTIKREKLGRWQFGKLKNMHNVTVQTGALVTHITKECIVFSGGQKAYYDYLVGADGSCSLVRKFLNIDIERYGVAFQHIVHSAEYDNIEIVLDSRLFHAWYAWIFPYNGSVSIGTGYFPKITSGAKTRKKFDQWLKSENIDVKDAKIEAHPINCDYRGFQFGNVFLVGDAAGLTSGFTGEGIYQALVCGEEVAKLILDQNYHSNEIDEILREKKVHEFLVRLLIVAGPLRDMIFYLVVFFVKIPFLGRTLLRILS